MTTLFASGKQARLSQLLVALLIAVAVDAGAKSAGSGRDSDSLDKLSDDFWAWRAKYAPFTGDDVNRMERPGGKRDWSRAGNARTCHVKIYHDATHASAMQLPLRGRLLVDLKASITRLVMF